MIEVPSNTRIWIFLFHRALHVCRMHLQGRGRGRGQCGAAAARLNWTPALPCSAGSALLGEWHEDAGLWEL